MELKTQLLPGPAQPPLLTLGAALPFVRPASSSPAKIKAMTSSVLPFDSGNSRMLFASLLPQPGNSAPDPWRNLCAQLDALLEAHGFAREDVVKQNVFLRSLGLKISGREFFNEYYAGTMPATSFISQPPAGGQPAALEVLAIRGDQVRVQRLSERLTLVRNPQCRWAYVGGIEARGSEPDTYTQALSCFEQLHSELQSAGFHFNQVVRTWIYERAITGLEKSGGGGDRQRYQIFNDARRQFFTRGNNGSAFNFSHELPPASTGIGTAEGDFVMECLALDVPTGAIAVTPLRNPEQIDAHAYSPEVLERGAAGIKAAPLFSRGMSIAGDYRMLLISGTASIKGQQTVCLGDAARQAETTLENIALVLREADASLSDIQQARVYIKPTLDPDEMILRVAAIRSVLEAALPRVPTLYLAADVCRDNLLVEIEALSFVRTL